MANGVMKYIDPELEKIIDTIQEEHPGISSSVAASRELVEILQIIAAVNDLDLDVDDVLPREEDEDEKGPSVKI